MDGDGSGLAEALGVGLGGALADGVPVALGDTAELRLALGADVGRADTGL